MLFSYNNIANKADAHSPVNHGMANVIGIASLLNLVQMFKSLTLQKMFEISNACNFVTLRARIDLNNFK
jgi:hypothetical protein